MIKNMVSSVLLLVGVALLYFNTFPVMGWVLITAVILLNTGTIFMAAMRSSNKLLFYIVAAAAFILVAITFGILFKSFTNIATAANSTTISMESLTGEIVKIFR